MRSFGIDETELLRLARARADELREDWRVANPRPQRRAHNQAPAFAGSIRLARASAGRVLIWLGRRVQPAEIEPCS
jgi:hypothetical protein